ncbi:MAG: hypothetical protein ACP5OR_08185 [Candidatus Dormibacteria bacterium]
MVEATETKNVQLSWFTRRHAVRVQWAQRRAEQQAVRAATYAEQLEAQAAAAARQAREQREQAGSLKEASEDFATRHSIIRELEQSHADARATAEEEGEKSIAETRDEAAARREAALIPIREAEAKLEEVRKNADTVDVETAEKIQSARQNARVRVSQMTEEHRSRVRAVARGEMSGQ